MPDRLLTVAEVAQVLRLNPETVRRWLRQGRLHGISLGSDRGGWRVRESDLQRLVEGAPAGLSAPVATTDSGD